MKLRVFETDDRTFDPQTTPGEDVKRTTEDAGSDGTLPKKRHRRRNSALKAARLETELSGECIIEEITDPARIAAYHAMWDMIFDRARPLAIEIAKQRVAEQAAQAAQAAQGE
jgi:hypothetical protein